MFRFKKAMLTAVLTCAAFVGVPGMANANSIVTFFDVGSATTVTVGPNGSLVTPVVGSPLVVGGFTITNFSASFQNASPASILSTTTLSVVNNGVASNTLRITVSSQDFTLPSNLQLNVESGLAGTVATGTMSATFQGFADAANLLNGNGFTTGLQNCTQSGSTCDTGSAVGVFVRNAGPANFSVTTVQEVTLGGETQAQVQSHETLTNRVPEPQALVLIGMGLIGLTGFGLKRKKA